MTYYWSASAILLTFSCYGTVDWVHIPEGVIDSTDFSCCGSCYIEVTTSFLPIFICSPVSGLLVHASSTHSKILKYGALSRNFIKHEPFQLRIKITVLSCKVLTFIDAERKCLILFSFVSKSFSTYFTIIQNVSVCTDCSEHRCVSFWKKPTIYYTKNNNFWKYLLIAANFVHACTRKW